MLKNKLSLQVGKIGVTGFEPAFTRSQAEDVSQITPHPNEQKKLS